MSEPDTTITMRQVLGRVPSPSRLLRGIRAHVVFLFLCGVLLAVVIPQSPRLPGLWIGWLLSLCAAGVLLCMRQAQPGIDDREVDMILAVTALGAGIWTLRQWPGVGSPVAVTAAWLLCLAACLLMLSGTRAMMWVWPAALPALMWLLPPPGNLITMAAVVVLGAGAVALVVTRRGWAPEGQLGPIPASHYVTVGVALVLVAVLSRIGVVS